MTFAHSKTMRGLLLAGLSTLSLAMAGGASAQELQDEGEGGNEIVVTATKRNSTVQDVPFSINAQTEADIRKSGATTVEDLSRNVAGLAVQNLGPGQSQVSIRGVASGQIARDQPGVKEQVGVYLDESVISMSLFTPDLDLFDLNRVETLRGPQGTLFGSGSMGGTIRYITNQPRFDRTEGKVEANINLVDGKDVGGHLKGAVNMPMGENAAVRAVGYYTRYGGFIDAVGPAAGKNINDGERYGGRLAVALQLGDALTLTPRVVYQKISTNGFNREEVYNFYANPYTTSRPAYTFGERQQYLKLREKFVDKVLIGDLTAAIDTDVIDVTSVTSYTNRDILVSRDASALTGSVSWSPFVTALGVNPALADLPSNLRDTTKLKQFTQELRFASDNEGAFNWVVGGFYSHGDRKYQQLLPTPGYDAYVDAALGAGTSAGAANGFPLNSPYNAAIPYKLDQLSIFGEANYEFGPLTATAGLRHYTYKEVRTFKSGGLFANGDNNRDKTSASGFNPRLLLSFEVSPRVTLNAQMSKGFRLGGVNDPLNIPLCSGGATGPDARTFGNRPTFKDESLWNYEGGIKSQFGAFTFNAAAFYNKIKNLQVTADAGSCSSRIVFNAEKAHSKGVEVEMGYRPVSGLDLSLSGSLIDAKFDSTLLDSTGTQVIAGIRKGNRLPSTPKFQMSANANYSFPMAGGEAYLGAAFQHVGSRYTQPGDQEPGAGVFSHFTYGGTPAGTTTNLNLKLPSYELVNLSAGIDFENNFGVMLYVNNLLDENALLAFDRERGGRARLGFSTNTPRTYGVTVRKGF